MNSGGLIPIERNHNSLYQSREIAKRHKKHRKIYFLFLSNFVPKKIKILFGRNKSFFSLFGLWETLGDSADALGGFGKLWGGFGRLWGCFGDALGGFGEALGGFGDARRPPPNP